MSASDLPADSVVQMAKRLSCERCRSQRLRCIRDDKENDKPCARCAQAQVACVVRRRKAPGRPAGRKRSARVASQANPEGCIQVRALENNGLGGSHDGPHDLAAVFADYSFDMDPESMFDGPWNFLPDAPGLCYGQDNAFDTDIFNIAYTNGFEGPSPTNSEATSSDSPIWHSTATTPPKVDALPTPGRRISTATSEAALDLPRLHQSFANHLAQLRATPWDILETLRLDTAACCSSCQCRSSLAGHLRTATFDPLPSTFRLVAEFEKILHDIRTPEVPAAAAADYASQMKLSYALTAVSCYIQLVLVYDCILSHLAEQCANNRVVRDFVLRYAPPPLILSGQQVLLPARNFLGKTLVRLLEQRIGVIEGILGLPDDFCVSRRERQKGKRSKTVASSGFGENVSSGNASDGVCSSSGVKSCRRLDDDDRSNVNISGSWGGEAGKSLLGVLQASLLTKDPETERPGVMENLRARMVYLEQLA